MPSDCLVLKIEESDRNSKLDHCIYIIYDVNNKHYILRGKRTESVDTNFEPYSFDSDSKTDIVDFMSFIMDKNDLLNYKLYNKIDLPWESNDITFEYLEESIQDANEMVAYDMDKFSKKTLRKRIDILEAIYNFY